MAIGDDHAFPISGTEFWIVQGRPYVRESQAEGFLVPSWFIAHQSDLDNHLHMLGHAIDPRDPYPPAEYEKAAQVWVEENAEYLRARFQTTEYLRPPPPKLPPDPPSPAG
jgi:hypothetical protein